ncbi:MAG: Ig domain protein group 2 domain protein [Anaerocolumna sp.]|jgi:uncharacterized protein YjdB|nr:Ig domain protein group 2 domain protein [Anaerocolumna sp.]
MKFSLIKKCLYVLGLYVFFTVIIPIPFVGNSMVAMASSVEGDQGGAKLNVKSKALVKDTTYALKVYNVLDTQKVTYKTDASSIATVDDSGVITAVDFGTTKITVVIKDGIKTIETLECEVTVGPPAISIKLTKSEITMTVGSKTTLTAILKPNNTVEEAMFSSNDSEIAAVSIGGRVTAKKAGVTYIFAAIGNGKFDMCKVTVVEENKQEVPETNTNNKETTTN